MYKIISCCPVVYTTYYDTESFRTFKGAFTVNNTILKCCILLQWNRFCGSQNIMVDHKIFAKSVSQLCCCFPQKYNDTNQIHFFNKNNINCILLITCWSSFLESVLSILYTVQYYGLTLLHHKKEGRICP